MSTSSNDTQPKLRRKPTGDVPSTADSIYRKFSYFVRRRSKSELDQTLYKTNFYLERFIAITYANHHRAIALLAVAIFCCLHLYQVNIPLFALAIAAIFVNNDVQSILLKIMGMYLGSAMIFLEIKPSSDKHLNTNATAENYTEESLDHQDDAFDSQWVFEESQQILNSILIMMLIFLSCAMQKLDVIRGKRICVPYPDIQRQHVELGCWEFYKFLFNFVFYKFGVSICWFSIAMQLSIGINALDIGLCAMLWLTLLSRSSMMKFWPFIRAQVGMYIVFKYIMEASSTPIHSTIEYSISQLGDVLDSFLPGSLHFKLIDKYIKGIDIVWNFFVALMISRHLWVLEGHWERYGGKNDENWHNFDDPDVKSDVEDYLQAQDTWLDVLKSVVLPNFPHVSILFIIFTSIYTANIFSLGYLFMSGYLVMMGSFRLYLRSIFQIRRSFQYLLAYNLLVISAKFLICSMVQQVDKTTPFLSVIVMYWSYFESKTSPEDMVLTISKNFYIDAIYLGLLLLIRRFIESQYFLHIKREYMARSYLGNWGTFLQAKGAKMQIKKKMDYIAELKTNMESRLKNEKIESAPLLKNAVMHQVVEIPKNIPEGKTPYSLTVWLWSTTLVFRFIEFGLNDRLKEVKEERKIFDPDEKSEPTEEELENLWLQYETNNLFNILWKPKPVQLLQAFWTCLRAHSQYVCFITIFFLQAFRYCSFYTLPLPLSVLYASKRHPRPSNLYWNGLVVVVFSLIIGKLVFATYLGESVIARIGGRSAHWEAFLFVSIIWHKSILRTVGLWNSPISLQRQTERVAFVDVYSCIFVIQVTSTLIVLGSFSSFAAEARGDDSKSVVDLDSDSVPVSFLILIFLHLIGMALDRIFYVSAAFGCRKVFHTIVYLSLHFWLFHFVPHFTRRKFGYYFSQQIYYFLQSIYLLLSAYQVRTCHSRCSAVSILCQSFNRINMLAFLAYSNIPFLEPVRRSIDFFFTKTLLSREEFVLIESIFDLVFKVKCERVNEFKYLTNRPVRKKLKTVVGLFAILAMLMFIAAPLIYYTLEDTMTKHNHIKFLSLELSSPILGEMYMQRVSKFKHMNFRQYEMMKNHYGENRAAFTFLNEFSHVDVMVAKVPAISLTEWTTALPREEIARILRDLDVLRPTIKWVIERVVEGDEDFNDHTTMLRNKTVPNPMVQLADMIETGIAQEPVIFPDLLTKFLHFHRSDPSNNIKSLMLTWAQDPSVDDLLVKLVKIEGTDKYAWKLSEHCDTEEYKQHLSKLPFAHGCETLDIFLFSAHPPLFGFVKNFGGLIGMYAGVILSLWTYLAKIWKRDAYEMMFEEMVSPDKILQLCLDIYQCRITQQMDMELELGQKLINIFTSSSEFDKWTKGEYGVDARAWIYP